MRPHRILLAAALLFGLAATSARAEPPSGQPPGGPIWVKVPELYVESIDVTWTKESPCVGAYTAVFTATVKIKNGWLGTAYMPGPWAPPWIVVWSIRGAPYAPYTIYLGSSQKTLAPGQSLISTTKLTAMALYDSAKSQSSIGIGVIVDPNHAITELNENNNYKDKQLVFGGKFCA